MRDTRSNFRAIRSGLLPSNPCRFIVSAMSAKVLLLSSVSWPSVARLAAGFVHASCFVEALAPVDAAIVGSRYLSRWHRYGALFPHASMRAAIERARPDLAVCCDDRALSQLLSLYDASGATAELVQLVQRSLGNPSAMPRLISRSGFIAEARSEGIRVPETLGLSSRDGLDEAIATLGFPIVLKSDGSWGGEGVAIAHNVPEAQAAYERLSRAPPRWRSIARAFKRRDAHFIHDAISPVRRRICAQKFVAGHTASSAFAAWHGDIVGAIYYDALISDDSIGPPNVILRGDCPQLEAATVKIARRFGLSGIHGMDFIRDADGSVHLIEINPRATQGSTLAFGRGRDLPAALAGCLVPNPGVRPAIPNDLVAIFPREWRRDPASPFLASAHHDVPWDDPAVLLAGLGVPYRNIRRLFGRTGHKPPPIEQRSTPPQRPAVLRANLS
jgi:hypothetical protein